MQGRAPAFAQEDITMTSVSSPLAGPPGLELTAARTEDGQ